MAWTLFRTKKGLRRIEKELEGKIAELENQVNKLQKAHDDLWNNIEQKAREVGYGDDTDSYVRNEHQWFEMSKDSDILNEKFKLQREKIHLEQQLIKLQQKIQKSIF